MGVRYGHSAEIGSRRVMEDRTTAIRDIFRPRTPPSLGRQNEDELSRVKDCRFPYTPMSTLNRCWSSLTTPTSGVAEAHQRSNAKANGAAGIKEEDGDATAKTATLVNDSIGTSSSAATIKGSAAADAEVGATVGASVGAPIDCQAESPAAEERGSWESKARMVTREVLPEEDEVEAGEMEASGKTLSRSGSCPGSDKEGLAAPKSPSDSPGADGFGKTDDRSAAAGKSKNTRTAAFFAVYDGHDGDVVAEALHQDLHKLVAKQVGCFFCSSYTRAFYGHTAGGWMYDCEVWRRGYIPLCMLRTRAPEFPEQSRER